MGENESNHFVVETQYKSLWGWDEGGIQIVREMWLLFDKLKMQYVL